MSEKTQVRNRVRLTLLAVVLIASLMIGNFSAAQAQAGGPPSLFGDAGDARPSADAPNESHVARSRYVHVNVGMLFDASGKPLGKESLPEISLNLFPDANFTGEVTSVKLDRWASSWTGRLKGQQGYFYLVVADGVFIAHVASAEGVYEVSWAGDNLYRAIQIDQSKFVDEDPAATFDPPGEVFAEGDLGPSADSAARIDIMVAYTDDARAAAGSTAAMKALIALAVLETNTSYANAGVTTRLRLVHVEEYSYAETGNMSTDLSRLTGTADAYFTTVHSLRNTYAADMVGLIVENGGAYCGLANAVMATAANAFQVTDRSCATGYYSFGHEFGHLQGAHHDKYVATNTVYSYGHGYVHTGATASARWRTIMAYNDKCASLGYSCTRLQYWSNPAKTWLGAAMGNSTAKNYLVLNNTDYTVANFRTQVIANDFSSSFNTSSAGWSTVTGAWALNSGAYYRSTGLTNTGASAKHSGKFGDLTYEVRMKRTGTCLTCANRIIIRGNPASLDPTNWWKPSYVFQYANDGTFSVYEMSSAGAFTTLKTWTASAAVVQNDWNTLKVIAVGSSLKFYINGTLVWSGSDSTLQTGLVGFGFYRDTAADTLDVDWAKLSTTATADLNEAVAPGEEIPGGNANQSP